MSTTNPELSPGTLRLRRIGIDTYRENVAYLHRDCAIYRAEGFQALSKIAVGSSRVDLQACKLEYSIVSPK